jgi:fructokinase
LDKFVSATNIAPGGFDVACLGELVIDMVPALEPDGRRTFEPKAGGAPGNVAVGLARLGRRVAMLAKVGDEAFGAMLVATLRRAGIDTSGVVLSADHRTSLAFVVLGEQGERDFVFYRDNVADMFLDAGELALGVVRNAAILHVNTVMLLGAVSARTQGIAIETARATRRLVSIDLNFRRQLWPDARRMVALGRDLIRQAAVVKMTEDELADVATGGTSAERVRSIWHPDLRICAITRGAAGAELFTGEHHVAFPGFAVHAVDTTGAGDAFAASLLSDLVEGAFDLSSRTNLQAILVRACAAGALCATAKGAMEAMPDKAAIAVLAATAAS